ncbi:MAG: ABC transporter substrate-binding protein [Phyllobacteriaceae bacterium]|nr:ABC transporter substrate-binding protein [Phyllobacteriaceae bacterium]
MKTLKTTTAIAALLAAGFAAPAFADGQGVTDTEVVIGSNGDLSGPFAAFNVQAIKAAQIMFDDVNAKGGVHGRKIKFVVEDHGYQVPKAVQNFNKLVNSDKAFAMVLNLGTPHNLAGFKIMDPAKVANVGPLTAARQLTVEGDKALHYAGFSTYYDQIIAGVEYLAKEKGAKEVCSMILPTDFGQEIQAGAKDTAAKLGLAYAAETTHKPDEQDFVGSLTKLKEAGCDIVATAIGVRQTIVAIGTAKKLGWNDVTFLGSSAAFNTAVAKVPGGVTEGFYAASGWSDFEARLGDPDVKAWAENFKAKSGEDPGTAAQLGWSAAETLVKALEAAGKDLNPASFQAAMEGVKYKDKVMDADIDYGADHIGGVAVFVSKIEGGMWKEVLRK